MTSVTSGRERPCGAPHALLKKQPLTARSMSDSRSATRCAAPSCDDLHTLRKLKTRSEARLNAMYMKR